jgi:hypothetical protein
MYKILILSKKDYKNNEIDKIYVKYLITKIYNYNNNIISDNFLISLLSFHPLSDNLILFTGNTSIIINNNIISFISNMNEYVSLFGNRSLLIYNLNPIPFTILVKNNQNIELLNSNVYYYEV